MLQPMPNMPLLDATGASQSSLAARQRDNLFENIGVHGGDDTKKLVSLQQRNLDHDSTKCFVMETIGDRVTERRNALGLNQVQLAALVGKKQQNIQQLEDGVVKSPRYLLKLAEALGVTPHWLETGNPPKFPSGSQEEDARKEPSNQQQLTPRQIALLQMFDELTPSQQDRFMRDIEDTQRTNKEVIEYQIKRSA